MSRALTSAERNYAQIEKELLAIVFATKRFHQYTYGRSVIVESDHKPLEAILAKPLVSAPKRLQKMILRLQRYDLDVRYKKGRELYIADTLSRHYPKLTEATQDLGEHVLLARSTFEEGLEVEQDIQEINHLLVNEHEAEMFRVETENDEVLQSVKAVVQSGWPADKRELPLTLALYYDVRDELVIQGGLLFRGDRLVIPKTLRKRMLQTLHSSHQGIESTLRRARETIYWPNMKSDIKDFTSKCETCATYSTRQQKDTLTSHDVPDRPWAKISTDLFDLDHKSYMVTVDYVSGFVEIDRLYDLKTSTVIRKLKGHMARYGIPDEVVYTSREFKAFAKEYGFTHVTTSPYHHQSNGKAESAEKEAKKILKKSSASNNDPYLALLAHRNTPQEGFGTSPAQRLLSRRTKTNLPTSSNLLKPNVAEGTLEKDKLWKLKQKFYYDRSAKDLPGLQKDDVVRMQPFRLNEKTWKKAKVVKPLGRRSYVVESSGQLYIRNRRHLNRSAEDDSPPTEEWPTPSNHHDSKVEDSLTNDQPPVEPVTTIGVYQPMTTTASNKDQPLSSTTVDQDRASKDQPLSQHVSPASRESQVRTRSGRLIKPPSRFKDFVTLGRSNK